MRYKAWNLLPRGAEESGALEGAGIPPLACAVLCARGIAAPGDAMGFLSRDAALLHDPFLLRDMDRAVARIHAAAARGERVAVYGDYDVDGITATCLLTDCLRRMGLEVEPYIPDRVEEGYGLNCAALDALRAGGATLVVTVDCGITAVEEVAYARSMGMDVIVTDHHECKETLPDASAVVNPHRSDCDYPFVHLAGVGVALKLAMALGADASRLEGYYVLAAIGTVADVMRLTDENRAIVSLGLAGANRNPCPGLRMLMKQAGLEERPLTTTAIGYMLAPRLNAAGRIDCARVAVELLLTDDLGRAEELAGTLCQLNRRRQEIEGEIYAACVARISRAAVPPALVLDDAGWHQGVVGIVASRLAERYARPAFMICLTDGRGKGSCRSYGGFNLFAALAHCAHLLESFGGHELAAGFVIAEENIPAFRAEMEDYVARWSADAPPGAALDLDVELTEAAQLTLPAVEGLDCLEPHGAGNERPIFLLSGCTVLAASDVGGGKHLKLRLGWNGLTIGAIFFSSTCESASVKNGDRVDVAATLGINEFRGERSVQLQVVDLRPAVTRLAYERTLYERLRAGGPMTACEARAMIPTREEFAAVWRYLRRGDAIRGVEQSAGRFAREVARTCRLRETYRTMVCLDAMHQCGLLELRGEAERLHIRVRDAVDKVDLETSDIMRNLRKLTGD